MPVLKYGTDSVLKLDLEPQRLLARFGAPTDRCLDDPSAAMAAALAAPLDFPPLDRVVTPGDRVVVAVDQGIPCVGELVASLVAVLVETGIQPADIKLLCPSETPELPRCLMEALPANVADKVRVCVHDPSNRSQLCHLALDERGRPIYVSRHLFDADVVLPLGCVRDDNAVGYNGIYGCLYPTFSDTACRQEFLHRWSHGRNGAHRDDSVHDADRAGWLLGAIFTIQIVPGGNGQVLQILAGESRHVAKRSQQICSAAWRFSAPQRASLVVAAVPNHETINPWPAVGRSLAAASRLVDDGGAIVLCTEIEKPPTESLQEIGRADDLQQALRHIRSRCADDVLPAIQLANALEQARVYLISWLDETTVEDLGMVHVEQPSDIARLAARSESYILLEDAQHVIASVAAGGVADQS